MIYKNILFVILLTTIFSMTNAQVLQNNNCSLTAASQWVIDGPCASFSTAAFTDNMDPSTCGSGWNQPDGWGWFVGDGNSIEISITTTGGNPVIHVYTLSSAPCTYSGAVPCVNANGAGGNESLTIPTTLGTIYHIMVESEYGDLGEIATGCMELNSVVSGCTDPTANNYNPLATVDDGSCTYNMGCTDPTANNYDPTAVVDDGSCTYNTGCTDPLASNYDPTAVIDDGSCVYPGGIYYHPTTGVLSSYSGACPVATDAGIYYDDGGASNNYSNAVNQIYRTFCPSTEGECVRLTFNSFETYNSSDWLRIQNGPAQNSATLATLWGDLNGSTPFSYQASNSSGCLTLRFRSSAAYNDPGWAAVITNVPCTEAQPVNNSDCNTATPICSNTSFSGVANGPGIVTNEGCDACLTGEVYSNWYTFTVQTGGTIGLAISPLASADYDFTLYRGSCGGTMERCSFAPQTGNTGLGNGASDLSEGVTGDSWVSTINVNAGDVFYLMINSWTATGPGFNLNWNLTNGASLDCTILPIELAVFDAAYDPTEMGTNLYWRTESEKDNDHFVIEKSMNNEDFQPLFQVNGAGTTSNSTDYYAFDPNVKFGVTYYRLKQVDVNGEVEYSEVKSVNVFDESLDVLTITPNPSNGNVNLFFNSYSKDDAKLLITDVMGNILVDKNIDVKKSGNNISLDLSRYEDGIYLVQIQTNHKTYSGRLIKK